MTAANNIAREILDRLPPQDLDAEESVLGSLLLEPNLIDEVAVLLKPDRFYSVANRIIYAHMLAMREEGQQIDIVLLRERLKGAGDFDSVGGDGYVAELIRAVPTASLCTDYAHIVLEKAQLRDVKSAACETLRELHGGVEPLELCRRAEERFGQIATTGRRAESVDAAMVVDAVLQRARDLREHGSTFGLATGLFHFDEQLGGLHRGELIVVAARPRTGKTTLALQIAMFNALRERTVLFHSVEMGAVELMTRGLATSANVDSNRFRTAALTDNDVAALESAGEQLRHASLHIVDRPSVTVADVRATAKQLQRREGLSLVIVDYLQRLIADNPRRARYEQVAQMSGDLKRLARELDVPVLVLTQLNREVESSADHRPKLSHLRESGDIEQDADMVAFLHRDELYDHKDADLQGKARLYVDKNRNGPQGEFDLHWDVKMGSYLSVELDLQTVPFEDAIESAD